MLTVRLGKLALAGVESFCLKGIIEGLIVDDLIVGEEQKFVSLQCEHWLDLIQNVSIVYLQLFGEFDIQLIPAHQSTRSFFLQIVECDCQNFLRFGFQLYLIQLILQRTPVQHYQKISKIQSFFLEYSRQRRNVNVRHYHLIQFLLYQSLFQSVLIFFHDLLVILSISFQNFLLTCLSNDERNLPFQKRRHNNGLLEKFTVLSVAKKESEMAEFDASHQLIEAHPSILSHQQIFCQVSVWELLLQELDELFEHLSMHLVSYLNSKWPLCVQLLQTILLFCLELVEIDVNPWSLLGFFLAKDGVLKVISLNYFSFLPILIINITNPVTELAIFLLVDAKASHIEPAKGFLVWYFLIDDLFHVER